MEYSLSTSWNYAKHKNGAGIVDEIKSLGFDTIELNFALSEQIVSELLAIKDRSGIKVSSLHNMCPLPPEIAPEEASPDYYSLASLDEDERSRAVAIAKNTIACARKFGARTVILHIGRVVEKDRTRKLASLFEDKEKFAGLKEEMIAERHKAAAPRLERAIKSLKELVPFAGEKEIAMGIENRYYYGEIPIKEELDEIFGIFKEGALYYWHDVGHAEVFERLGFVRHKDLLDKFSSRLIGIHLHDILGTINDHRAPGYGTFDFGLVRPYITEDTIKVIEAHKPATATELRLSVKYLEKTLGSFEDR